MTIWPYFRLAGTPGILADIDKWRRHRLRALQLKPGKRERAIRRELTARGMAAAAVQGAANARPWWHNPATAIHIVLPNALFDTLGVPRLAA